MNLAFMRPMQGRNINDAHRTATPLELLYDLCFVVAIAVSAHHLAHAVTEHHLGSGLAHYVSQFFAIWWAWMTYTWFASAYDNDDVIFRLLTALQMFGILVMAVGLENISNGSYFTVTIGYSIMRIGQVLLWLRVAKSHPEGRATALRYAIGTFIVQALWLARLALPDAYLWYAFGLLVIAELAVPIWAARKGHTPWHAHHIAERFGLLTIIVLGEGILSISKSIGGLIELEGISLQVFMLGLGSTTLILAIWWLYFQSDFAHRLHHQRHKAFVWSYSHFPLFMVIAAVGAFLSLITPEISKHETQLSFIISTLVSGSIVIFLICLYWLNQLFDRTYKKYFMLFIVIQMALLGSSALVLVGIPVIWTLIIDTALLSALIFGLSVKRGAAQHSSDGIVSN